MTIRRITPLAHATSRGRRAVHAATSASAPIVGPITRPFASMMTSGRSMLRHVPAVAQGAMEQMHALVPSAIAQQLPARTAEVDALEARVRRLETAAVAKTAPKPRSSAPKASKARPSATR